MATQCWATVSLHTQIGKPAWEAIMCLLPYHSALHHRDSFIPLERYRWPSRTALGPSGPPQRSKQTSALPRAMLAPCCWHRAPQHIPFLNSPSQSEAGSRAATAQLPQVPPAKGFFDTARSMPLLSGQAKSKIGVSLLLLTDANCSLSMNVREAKISSALFRISGGKAARYSQGETQAYQLSKADREILHCLYIPEIKHTCSNLFSNSFFISFRRSYQCNLPENSCCQTGRLGDLSHAQFKIIRVGALSSALKFFLFFQFPVQVPCLLPWLKQQPFRLNLTIHNSCCYHWKTSLMRSQSNPNVPAHRESLF